MSFEIPYAGIDDCIFCSIVAGDSEATWESTPTSDSLIACFHNRLKWERVMLLIVPTVHMTQKELWSTEVLKDAAQMAVEMGDKHCGDEGYKAISNFGLQAHQSQSHGHIHLVSGTSRQLQSASMKTRLDVQSGIAVDEYDIEEIPFVANISPVDKSSQRDLWESGSILETSVTALEVTERHSPNGFRLMSNFEPATAIDFAGSNPAGLFLLGGGQLGLYV